AGLPGRFQPPGRPCHFGFLRRTGRRSGLGLAYFLSTSRGTLASVIPPAVRGTPPEGATIAWQPGTRLKRPGARAGFKAVPGLPAARLPGGARAGIRRRRSAARDTPPAGRTRHSTEGTRPPARPTGRGSSPRFPSRTAALRLRPHRPGAATTAGPRDRR